MMFGGVDEERIVLSTKVPFRFGFTSGRRPARTPAKVSPAIQNTLIEGNNSEAEALMERQLHLPGARFRRRYCTQPV